MVTSGMESSYYAAIDIGSNAVRLLIKRLDDAREGVFSKVVQMRVPLRLGQEAFSQGCISHKKAHDLRELLRAYSIVMGIYDIKPYHFRGCATAAMREATNGASILADVARRTGLNIDIISGVEEAHIVCSAHRDDQRDIVYVDVGGGSTEVTLISDGKIVKSHSYPIGTVRMLHDAVGIGVLDDLIHDMNLLVIDYPNVALIGAGGNINKLFEISDEQRMSEQQISLKALRSLHDEMASMSVSQRIAHFRLKPDRADVIVPAAELFIAIADALGVDTVEVPSKCLADGIIETLYKQEYQ